MRELVSRQVDASWPGGTLERWLRRELGFSTSLLRKLKACQGLYVNGALARTVDVVRPGDLVRVLLPAFVAPHVTPEPVTLSIVFEDRDIVLLDKPAGIVVHPTHGVYSGTLANGLAWHWQQRGEIHGVHPLHRLDRDTSGLVLFAKHPWAHQHLDAQLKRRDLKRTYLAMVSGCPEQPFGTIDAPIALRGDHPVARAVDRNGQTAVTHWERVKGFGIPVPEGSACLRLTLDTGRTHQIRVHLSYSGHPIWGDRLYGRPAPTGLARQALHAATLGFFHPRTAEWFEFSAPLPSDMTLLDAVLSGVETVSSSSEPSAVSCEGGEKEV
ncbi:MAG: RluA family pseudouridine synthase [Candidatus Sericytochromatia bacterium]|nr:RluA family pseudouridine synthase [Candidatus Sericytochromatia bacterium]